MAAGLHERTGWTLLHEAAKRPGEVEWLEELLKHQADEVNQQSSHGDTPLLLACQYKCVGIAAKAVNLLLQYGANVNISDNQDRTPLLFAAMKGKLDVVTTLLNSGLADPNLGDCFGCNPVHEAAVEGHWEIVECLLLANASILSHNVDGVTPVYLAAADGKSDCLRKILQVVVRKEQKVLINLRTERRGFTPLMGAAKNGHMKCVQILLKYGANPYLKTDNSEVMHGLVTALHLAVYGDHAGCVKLLSDRMDLQHLRCRANFSRYVCPLQVAVKKKSHKSLKVLLSLGFPVNNVHEIFNQASKTRLCGLPNIVYSLALPHHETSLSYAAIMEDVDSMKILLDHGASMNPVSFYLNIEGGLVKEKFSFPPVLSTLFRGTWEPFDLLIERGYDINNNSGVWSSNQCFLFSLWAYDSAKKLLMCGSDPHLLYEQGRDFHDILRRVSFILSRVEQQDAFRILELLLKFSAIVGPVQHFFCEVFKLCAIIRFVHGFEQWCRDKYKAIQEQLHKPSSLEDLCRIKIRRSIILSQGYFSFQAAIHHLPLPQMLKEYLLYSEMNEDSEHV